MQGLKLATILSAGFLIISNLYAARISDIANTSHNLSTNWSGVVSDSRSVVAVSESQICVFCHTPHGATLALQAPLWNRSLEGDTGYTVNYQMYDSSSMDASSIAGGPPSAPSNASKLCLSCHDGVIAVGSVNVLNGSSQTITMNGTQGTGEMPFGSLPNGASGQNTGLTRNLGTDLRNDHPISFTYLITHKAQPSSEAVQA